MSLVAYGNSDSEGESSENEDRENGKVEIPEKGLFKSLPVPNVAGELKEKEEDDEYLKKKEVATEQPEKRKVKITVPSLSEFADDDDDDEPSRKKQKKLSKTSGLFALLPPPKTQPITTKHFVPNSVKRNMAPKPVTSKKIQRKPVKKTEEPQVAKPLASNVEESDDEELKDIPDTFDEETWQKVCGRPKRTPRPIVEEPAVATEEMIDIAPEPVKPYQGLDNEAFKEFLGANSKRKGENIVIFDVSEDQILDKDKHIWMTKSLTDPEMSAKYVVKDPVNDTCRRKHHITYLAQQAKANEQELQNQWASNRFTRQKTQAKYGF